MHAQIITYQLNDSSQNGISKQMVEPDASILADVSGLISKVWLADEENTFGGFYLWESKEAMETFMQSDFVAAVVSRPFVKNVSSVDYPVNEAASKNYSWTEIVLQEKLCAWPVRPAVPRGGRTPFAQ